MHHLALVAILSLSLAGCVRSDGGVYDPSKGGFLPAGSAGIIATGGGNLAASASETKAAAPTPPVADEAASADVEATEATSAAEPTDR